MWLEREFMDEVRDLYVPTMGTDVMAPMLYSLIRFARASRVLEAGMGYTTPFIAKALQDNEASFHDERAALRPKTVDYLSEIQALGPDARVVRRGPEKRFLSSIYETKTSELAERRTAWMFAEPAALLNPGYYLEERECRLVCVDDASAPASSAPSVSAKLETLGLAGYVQEHRGEFWSADVNAIRAGGPPFDLIWIDIPVAVKNLLSLIDGPHWDLLNPDGGLLIVHDMLTHEGGQLLVEEFLKPHQKERFNEFELVGLLEPQRVVQNSFVMIRRISGHRAPRYEKDFTTAEDGAFEAAAKAFVAES